MCSPKRRRTERMEAQLHLLGEVMALNDKKYWDHFRKICIDCPNRELHQTEPCEWYRCKHADSVDGYNVWACHLNICPHIHAGKKEVENVG